MLQYIRKMRDSVDLKLFHREDNGTKRSAIAFSSRLWRVGRADIRYVLATTLLRSCNLGAIFALRALQILPGGDIARALCLRSVADAYRLRTLQ